MATVKLTHRWADGDVTETTVSVATSYPDAVAEARACATAAFRDAIDHILTGARVDDDADE